MSISNATVNGRSVIVKDGNAYILSDKGKKLVAVPLAMCQLAAGKDAWMRQIPVHCSECGDTFNLADSDHPEFCQSCFDAAGEENARLDGL